MIKMPKFIKFLRIPIEKKVFEWSRILLLISFFLMSSSSFAENQVLRDFIKSTSTSEKIEFYWSKPEGNGPFPALLMIHPEQDSPKKWR